MVKVNLGEQCVPLVQKAWLEKQVMDAWALSSAEGSGSGIPSESDCGFPQS